jgi:hypothetical protein
MADIPPDVSEPEVSWRTLLALLIGIVVVVGAVTTVIVALSIGGGDHDAAATAAASPHGAVAPLDLSTVSDDIAGHYRFAAAHAAELAQIPCWCGCQQFLGHRNLADCFVRADGAGWEAHAAGCGVCNAEAVIAERMLGEGHSPLDVKVAVDSQFGTTAITAPPRS